MAGTSTSRASRDEQAARGPPLYIGTGPERFFAFFHEAEPSGGTAVLICAPFGWEDMCSYRIRREWAQQLAATGHPALRFDLPSSGDSAGDPADPGRVRAWTDAISAAAGWLHSQPGVERVAAIGIGMGGLLASRAALTGAPIDELVLWGVPSRGRALTRELTAFSRLEVASIGDPDAGEEHPSREPVEGLVANGYLLSPQTLADLQALDLDEITGECTVRRALLLSRDGLSVDERLQPRLELAGVKVSVADGHGYGEMTVEPQDARPPTEVFALVEDWLGEGPRGGGAAAAARCGSEETLALSEHGVELSERALFIDGPDGRLFGILTEPVGPRRDLCAVLLNAGPQRHTGPNRMWVETARRWAARGVPCLRVDLAAIGDSDGDSSVIVHVASLYEDSYVEQVAAVMDGLRDRGLPDRFLLLGLCSGAYWGMHAALADERVESVVMLNPRAIVFDEFEYAMRRTHELRERLLMGSTWRKVLRGDITPARHLETAKAIAARARERAVPGARREKEEPRPIDSLFDGLRDRDQRVLMTLTGKEPLRKVFTDNGLFERLASWPNLEVVLTGTSADTHTLTPPLAAAGGLRADRPRARDGAAAGQLSALTGNRRCREPRRSGPAETPTSGTARRASAARAPAGCRPPSPREGRRTRRRRRPSGSPARPGA